MVGVVVFELRRLLRGGWRLLIDPRYRFVKRLAWFGGRAAFQPFNATRENRYPRIFAFLRDALAGRDGVHVLSFGCSTGEEAFSLRAWLPDAAIKGIDLNPANLAAARARLASAPDSAITFMLGDSAAEEGTGRYDAVLCLAVLRDGRLGGHPARCDHLIRFADFDRAIAEFARILKPGGFLAIRFANFRVLDSSVAGRFDRVLALPASRKTPIYGCDDRLVVGAEADDGIYRKRAD